MATTNKSVQEKIYINSSLLKLLNCSTYVQESGKVLVPFTPGSPPCLSWHDSVMEDMKEGEMGELLLEDEEDGVEHVDELRNVEVPGHVKGAQRLGGGGEVYGLAAPAVVATDIEPEGKEGKEMEQ